MKQKPLSADAQAFAKQKRALAGYKKREHWLRWGLTSSAVIVILLFLLLGVATDWTRGLHKGTGTDGLPIASNLDSLRSADGVDTANTTGRGATTNTTTSEAPPSTSTTTNNTTTNNSTTATTPPSTNTPSTTLLDLYADSSTGENMSELIDRADQLGITQECHNELLFQVCTFSDGNSTVTAKSIVGTGTVTSILNNFNQ